MFDFLLFGEVLIFVCKKMVDLIILWEIRGWPGSLLLLFWHQWVGGHHGGRTQPHQWVEGHHTEDTIQQWLGGHSTRRTPPSWWLNINQLESLIITQRNAFSLNWLKKM